MCGGVVGDILGGIGDVVEDIVDPVVDFGESFVESLGQGVEDLFEGDIDAVLRNPAVVATASFAFPKYAALINLGSKAATGQDITATDLAAAGLQSYSQLQNVKIPKGLDKAVMASAQIADGKDPVQVLAKNYGANFAKDLGLDKQVSSALNQTFGQGTGDYITNRLDVNKAAADLVAGKDITRTVAEQFNEDIVAALGADTPTQRAAGLAGIETLLQKNEGASDNDALLAGAKTYYDQGGALPDFNQIASLTGIEDFDLGLNDFVSNLNIDFPELQGRGYDLPSLASLGINLPSLSGIETPDLLSNFSLPEVADLGFDIPSLDFSGYRPEDLGNFSLPEIADLGVNIPSLDFSGYRPGELGDLSLPELADLGVNLGDLNLDLELGSLGVALLGAEQQQREQLATEEELLDGMAQFQPEFSELEGPSFAREVLGRRFT